MTPGVRDEGTGQEERGGTGDGETRDRKRERASAAASWSGPARFRSRIPMRGIDREKEGKVERDGKKGWGKRERKLETREKTLGRERDGT